MDNAPLAGTPAASAHTGSGPGLRWPRAKRVGARALRRGWLVFALLAFALLVVGVASAAPAVARLELGQALDCANAPIAWQALPPTPQGLRLRLAAKVPQGALLEVIEHGQQLTLRSERAIREVRVPPRYGSALVRVRHPFALHLDRLRAGNGNGMVELRLHCDPAQAERLWRWFEAADALSRQLGAGVGSLAEAYPEALLAAVQAQAFDPRTRALAAHLRAQTLLLAGRAADAAAAFAQAAEHWQALGDPERASAARVGLAEDLNRSGQYARVLALTRARPTDPEGGHYFGVRLENARCLALHYLGRLEQSAQCYGRTSAGLDALNETLELADTGIDYAAVKHEQGRPESARRLLLASLELAQGRQSLPAQGRAQLELARVAQGLGEITEALHRLSLAQERFAAAGERRWQANVLLRLGALLDELRAPDDARAAAELALTRLDPRNAPARVAAAQLLLARIELSGQRPAAGLRQVEAALATYKRLDMPEPSAQARLLRMRLLLAAGRTAEASSAFERVAGSRHDPAATTGAHQGALIRAELSLRSGKADQAARQLRALPATLSWGERRDRDRLLAEADGQAGRRQQAHAGLRTRARELAMLARLAGNALLAHLLYDSIDSLRQSAIELSADELAVDRRNSETVLGELTPWLLREDRGAAGSARPPLDPQLDAALAAVLLDDGAAIPARQTRVHRHAAQVALLDRMARRNQAAPTLAATHELRPQALQALARPGQPLLVLMRGRTQLLRLWFEAGRPPRIDRLELATLDAELLALRQPLALADGSLAEIDRHARALSQQLFAGLGGRPAPSRLQVLGDRLGLSIPWPLLTWPGEPQPLAERSAVSLLHLSSEPVPAVAPPAWIDVLVAAQDSGNGANALPALASAGFEAALIARQSPRRQVRSTALSSREQALAQLAEPGAWLHLSAHGQTRSDRLVGSGVWLDPAGTDQAAQFLSWADVLEQGVAADLVVLNACQLAQSDGTAASAALDFASALSRAGAHDIVAAQWPVSDTASAIWVPAFYRALSAQSTPDPGQALAQARRALRASRAFRHPFHWAGWVHVQRVGSGG